LDSDFLTVFGFTRLIVCLIGIVLGLELHDKSRMSRQFIWIINDNPDSTPKDDQDQDEMRLYKSVYITDYVLLSM